MDLSAMNISSNIISVDPARKTLGSLHPELTRKFRRHLQSAPRMITRKKTWLDFTFACSTPGSNRFGSSLLLLRLCFAALLVVSGAFIVIGEIYPPYPELPADVLGWSEIAVGISLVLGFMTRWTMLAAVAGFGTAAGLAISNGVFDMQSLMCCMGALVFLILGVGKYSCDFLLRKAIIVSASRHRRRMKAERLSYKAFRYSLH